METSVEGTPSFETVSGPQPELLPPPQNEPGTETPTSDQGSLLARLKSRTSGIFESAGVAFKRGGGRPRKDGKPNKLDIPITAPSTALPLGASPNTPPDSSSLDSALVKRCCSAVIKAFKGFGDKLLHSKAVRAGYSPKEAQQLVVDTTVTAEETDGFSELAEICLRKYGVGTQYAPEIGLGAIVLGVGLRYATAFKTLDADAKEKEAQP